MAASFGSQNQGIQVNYGSINTEFHLLPERPETPPQPFATIPLSRDPDFVNRGHILEQIDQRCSEPAARLALVGLGGVGKSQLAIEYAHRIAAAQPDSWVFWVHAGTKARVEERFRAIADAVKLPGRNQPKADIPQLVYGWLEAHGRQEMFKQQFVERIAAAFSTGAYGNWGVCQRLFAHVERAVDYRPTEAEAEKAWARLLYNGAWYAELQGRYDTAERMARKSRISRETRLGRDDERTLASTSLFAQVLRDKGLWEEAEKLFVQVMKTRKTKLGADHPSTLTSMANLASTLWNQGRWEEAEKLEVQVMETRKTKLGADHPETLTSMNNLAFTWKSQGRLEDALALIKDCARARHRVLGPMHPDTLSSLAEVSDWSS